MCFQTGRFMRLSSIRMAGPRAATGVVSGPHERGWFAPRAPRGTEVRANAPDVLARDLSAEHELLLGSPAISDAALQVMQSCVPHRRLLFNGCGSATFSGDAITWPVTILAAEVAVPEQASIAAGVQEAVIGVPRPRAEDQGTAEPRAFMTSGQPESVWNVHVTDSAGRVVMSLRRLRMRDEGSLPRVRPWPVSQVGCFLERAASELGLSPDFEVRVERRADATALQEADGWLRATADIGLSGLHLSVRADGRAGCGWKVVRSGRMGDASAVRAAQWLALLTTVRPNHDNPDGRLALARALISCTGADPGPASRFSADVRQIAGSDWLLLRSGPASIACALLNLTGVLRPGRARSHDWCVGADMAARGHHTPVARTYCM